MKNFSFIPNSTSNQRALARWYSFSKYFLGLTLLTLTILSVRDFYHCFFSKDNPELLQSQEMLEQECNNLEKQITEYKHAQKELKSPIKLLSLISSMLPPDIRLTSLSYDSTHIVTIEGESIHSQACVDFANTLSRQEAIQEILHLNINSATPEQELHTFTVILSIP
ncbi:MAG TPA: hypothetical protein VHA52_01030 [Candidatus Babeliaceae bacterium]|nr:hypothetical protein [Candidatus Babeliaceae bacterium]